MRDLIKEIKERILLRQRFKELKIALSYKN